MPVQGEYKTVIPKPKATEPIPADVYQVLISDVNLEERANPFEGGELQQRLAFNLTVLDEEHKGKSLRVWVANKWFVNAKSGIKSGLYALSDAVFAGYGTKVDMDFGISFNPNDLIGKQVRVTLVQVDKEGKTFNKVTGYMPIKKEMSAPKIKAG